MTIAGGMRTTFFFDGGCRPNPGRIEVAVVGAGVTWFRDDLGDGDNNEAEWLALLHAVERATLAGVQDVVFVGDSALVIEQASGRQRCRSPRLLPLLARYGLAVAAIPRVAMRQVPRHRNLAGLALTARARRVG